jgi:hypothetical protein
MTLNASKTKHMTISLRDKIIPVTPVIINDTEIRQVTSFKLLGVILDENLNFHTHVDTIISKSYSKSHALQMLKRYGLNTPGLCLYYSSIIRSLLTYACPAWFPSLSKQDIDKLETIQKRCLKIIFPNLDNYNKRMEAAKTPALHTWQSSAPDIAPRFIMTLNTDSLTYYQPDKAVTTATQLD